MGRIRCLTGGLVGCSLLLASMAWAQAPASVPTPTVVPRSTDLAPRSEPATAAPQLPAAPVPRELGKPEDDIRIDVRAYAVDDSAPPELKQALAGLTARYTGKGKEFEDLVNAAAEVTRFLQRELGYYLGYAYLPAQDPKDGIVRIGVLEGRLDRVVLNWSDGLPVDRSVVEAYLARLQPGAILRVRDVERVVFLVNDLRGITARFEVRSGATPGTAALVVTPKAESVYTGKVEFDGNGSRFLGTWRLGGLLQMNSPFGRGDGVTANVLSSTTRGLMFGLLGYTTPIGSDGFKVGASFSAVKYQLDKNDFPIDLNGTASTLNVYALYPAVRSRNLNVFAVTSLEHKQYEDRQYSVATRKTVDTISLGSTGDFRDSLLGGGVNTYDVAYISGSVKYPAGRPGGLQDAPTFGKITYGFSRLQDVLTGRMLAYLSLRGQQALKNLDTTEQFRLGGPEGMRAFAAGEGTGDSGAIVTLELRILPPEEWFGRVAREMVASVFYDAGSVTYRKTPGINPNPSPNPLPNTGSFTDTGLALSWVRSGEYALRMSLAKPISGEPRSDTQKRDPRLYVLFTKFFL